MVSDPVRSGLASHLAYPVVDPTNSSHTDILRNLEGSARPIAVKLKSLELGRPVDADGLLTTAVHERIESRARNHLQANRSVEFRFEILI